MMFAAIKLVDIAARSLFLLLVLFSLGDRAAGQFGLTVTLITWFTFLAGYERYADLQRSLLGRTADEIRTLLRAAVRFFALNHVFLLPIMTVLLVAWVELSVTVAILYLVVAVSEHLSQELYRLGLVVERYRVSVLPALIKNLALCFGFALWVALANEAPTMEQVSWMWAAVSAIALFATTLVAKRIERSTDPRGREDQPLGLKQQYQSSLTHFKLGAFALGSLQLDRFVVGALLPLEQGGVYFRHVMLVSFFYSAVTIVSYNRILPSVYAAARGAVPAAARSIVSTERRRVLTLSAVALVVLSGVTLLWGRVFSDAGLAPSFLATLLVAFTLRICADYNALLMNAAHREADVLRGFLLAALPTLVVNLILCFIFGIGGAVASFACGAALYLVATYFVLNHASRQS